MPLQSLDGELVGRRQLEEVRTNRLVGDRTVWTNLDPLEVQSPLAILHSGGVQNPLRERLGVWTGIVQTERAAHGLELDSGHHAKHFGKPHRGRGVQNT
ncbi:MAG: hypothetical protein AAGD10_10440 [Myxococcota bacterium]